MPQYWYNEILRDHATIPIGDTEVVRDLRGFTDAFYVIRVFSFSGVDLTLQAALEWQMDSQNTIDTVLIPLITGTIHYVTHLPVAAKNLSVHLVLSGTLTSIELSDYLGAV